jgi:hypothetical protein
VLPNQIDGLPVQTRLVPLSICAIVTSVAADLRADVAVDGQLSASATIGVTDNVANTPEDDPIGQPEADAFGTLSPAAQLVLETSGATQTLGYAFTYTFYFDHPEANTVGNSLTYGLRAPVTERTVLLLGLSGSQTNVATFNLATASAATPVGGNLGGDNLLFTFAGSQGVESELSETVVLAEAAGVQYSQTLVDAAEDQKTILGTFTLGLTKAFERDTLGGAFATDAQIVPGSTSATTPPVVTEASAQILHRLEGTWTHQYSPDWSTSLGAGGVVGYDAVLGGTPVAHPIGDAAITFQNERGNAALVYQHAAQPNVLLQQVTLNDTVSLRALLILGSSGFDLGGSGAFTATRSFLAAGGIGPPGYAVLADASIGWVPGESAFRVEARYQFTRQFAADPDASGAVVLPALSRHAGMLTFTIAWPGSPEAGGAAPFVALPPPTVSPDFLAKQAPTTERAKDESDKEEKDRQKQQFEERGGGGSK